MNEENFEDNKTKLVDGKSTSLDMCKEYLGKKVKIIIDQPYGTFYKNAFYEYNYGYIPDTLAPDGDELDAYFIGPQVPMETAEGICIAIIHRLDDDDDKLILTPNGENMTDEEIDKAVNFREKFFKHVIIR
jgi:inorganic pyrophosphatase